VSDKENCSKEVVVSELKTGPAVMRVTLREVKGKRIVDVRRFDPTPGGFVPTTNGMAFTYEGFLKITAELDRCRPGILLWLENGEPGGVVDQVRRQMGKGVPY